MAKKAKLEESKRRARNRRIRKHAKAKALKGPIEELRRLTALTLELHKESHRALNRVDPSHELPEDY